MRLWTFLAAVVNIGLAATLIGYGIYTANEQSEFRLQRMQQDVHHLSESIAAGVIDDLLNQALDKIELQLKRAAAISIVTELAIAGADGQILSSVKRAPDGRRETDYSAIGTPLDRVGQAHLNRDSYTLIRPISTNQQIGWIRITATLAEIDALRNHIWIDTLEVLLPSLIAATLIIFLIFRYVGAQLAGASGFASRLGVNRGEITNQTSPFTELGELWAALDRTSQLLDQQFRDLQDSESRKQAILEATADCLVTIDHNGRIVDWNAAAECTFGRPHAEVLEQPAGALIVPPERREEYVALLSRWVANRGQDELMRQRLKSELLRADGTRIPVELAVAPFEIGGDLFFLASMQDISKRRALQEEHQRTAAQLQSTVRELSALQAALDEHAIVAITDVRGCIREVNDKFCVLSGYAREELLGQNHRILKSGLHTSAFYENLWNTITNGKVWHGEIVNRTKLGELYWVTATIVPVLDEHGLPRRYIAIRTDITSQKRTERQLELSRQELEKSVERYRDAERALAEARKRELAIGNQIQRTLLSGELIDTSGTFDVAVLTEPSTGIDGDFYDFFSHGPGCFDIVVGDVMGKGVTAALIGAAVKQQLNRALAELLAATTRHAATPQPAELMNGLHRSVTPRLIELDTFVTMSYIRIDLERHALTYVGAGHPSAILAGHDGIRLLAGDNLPLGVMEKEYYVQREQTIEPGDMLFMYSDGLTEARDANGEEFGIERLGTLVAALTGGAVPVPVFMQAVRKAVRDFEGYEAIRDDRTCIALQQHESCSLGPKPVELDLPWDIGQFARLRKAIEQVGHESGLGAEAGDALTLAAFEAATNVLRHGGDDRLPDTTLHCRIADHATSVEVRMHYVGPPFVPDEREPDFSGESESGFGLFIIRSSVDEVIYDAPAPGVCRIVLRKNKAAANGGRTL